MTTLRHVCVLSLVLEVCLEALPRTFAPADGKHVICSLVVLGTLPLGQLVCSYLLWNSLLNTVGSIVLLLVQLVMRLMKNSDSIPMLWPTELTRFRWVRRAWTARWTRLC